ncbi:MAG: hypothetical protein IK088_08965, partial [Lachnospiraceae bacterium]|nr:hypothetical protein [Lachnospiraceae bacterium]
MGRYLLCGKEARLPYEVEDLDLCLYTIEELCYFLFHHPDLIGDDFIDNRLIGFIRNELDLGEIADKIERFYSSPNDLDATIVMLLSEVGYYSDSEITEFKGRLVLRKRRSKPERLFFKAKRLYGEKRYMKAVRIFRPLLEDKNDVRITDDIRSKSAEYIADAYGHLYCFDRSIEYLGRAYDESKQERLLKKMYDVSLLSGIALPEKYYKVV